MTIKQLIKMMHKNGIAKPSDLVPVSEFEIRNLEKKLKLKLPRAYRKYLSHFGRSAGRLSTWMAIYFDDLEEIRENFDLLLSKNQLDMRLDKNCLLISQMGSYFDYITCDGRDDPPVYRIEIQGSDGAFCEPCASSFSSYMSLLITNNKDEFSRIQDIHIDEDGDIFEEELNLVI